MRPIGPVVMPNVNLLLERYKPKGARTRPANDSSAGAAVSVALSRTSLARSLARATAPTAATRTPAAAPVRGLTTGAVVDKGDADAEMTYIVASMGLDGPPSSRVSSFDPALIDDRTILNGPEESSEQGAPVDSGGDDGGGTESVSASPADEQTPTTSEPNAFDDASEAGDEAAQNLEVTTESAPDAAGEAAAESDVGAEGLAVAGGGDADGIGPVELAEPGADDPTVDAAPSEGSTTDPAGPGETGEAAEAETVADGVDPSFASGEAPSVPDARVDGEPS